MQVNENMNVLDTGSRAGMTVQNAMDDKALFQLGASVTFRFWFFLFFFLEKK